MDPNETIFAGFAMTALLFGCSLVYFILPISRQKRRYVQFQRKYFSYELNLLEKERSRLARDLHDEIGPLLSMTHFHLCEVVAGNETGRQHQEKAIRHLQTMMKRMGEIAVNLTPVSLIEKGLQFSLGYFLNEVQEASHVNIHLEYEIKAAVPGQVAIHLFRIVQEITHNMIKHANATTLIVRFKERKGNLYLFCKDDGAGFEQDKQQRGLGTISIYTRTLLLGGNMRLKTKAGKGTQYLFEFPNFTTIVND